MKNPHISIFETLKNDNLNLKESSAENEKLLLKFLNSLSTGGEMDEPFFEDTETVISRIRERRTVTIKQLNQNAIKDIPSEMTFTSNVLLTIPGKETIIENLDLPVEIKSALPEIMNEEQLFWFDHPVQMGEVYEKNEIIYGLKGLSEAFAYEKEKNPLLSDRKLDVLLSVSVTHHGLQNLAAPYLRYEFTRCKEIKDLNIYIFTESDCKSILDQFTQNSDSISRYFGVDGKYGRHYNFLKAVNVLWKMTMNPQLKGTFKIDLDQVFPQEELIKNTDKSAFEHFQSPLWGAIAIDHKGRIVNLSMIAGALVNESDIKKSLFTPDVSFPTLEAPLNDLVFFKHLSMALSTRSELMTRYVPGSKLDGINKAISRIHVTGGTNGILIDALMKYRPFTPSFIGRAEDQAYILSVLNESEPLLRYYHEDGLVMRHDKEAFAGESIKASKDGTYIADIMRILYYSYYARLLPGGVKVIKEETYPFTGSYITEYPFTLSYMRFVYKLLEMYEEDLTERADNMMKLGQTRIQQLIQKLSENNILKAEYEEEKTQWCLFYENIETLITDIKSEKDYAINIKSKLRDRFEECRVF
jgi:hypothetical protein